MNTLFLLLAEYETAFVPLETVAMKYLGLAKAKAFQKANNGELPFPVFKSGLKGPWLVDLRELANWLDQHRPRQRRQAAT
jgi:hypothetical protein